MQLFEAHARAASADSTNPSFPAACFVFPSLAKKPESDFVCIHANMCYHEHCNISNQFLDFSQKKHRFLIQLRYPRHLMTKKSLMKWVPLAAMAAGLSSCIEINETVNLKKDGSGTITEETLMGAQMSAMMDQLAALGGGAGGGGDMFSEEAAKKRAALLGKGVTVAKVEKLDKDGRKGGRVTFSFTDINTVTLSLADGAAGLSAMAPEGAAEVEEKAKDADPVTFTYKEGVLTINTPMPTKEEIDKAKEGSTDALPKDAAEGGPEAAQMQAMAMQMMQELGELDQLENLMKNATSPGALAEADMDRAERDVRRMEGIICAMTPLERRKPELIKATRKRRIAAGAGVQVQEVNRLLKEFEQMQDMMKKMKGGGMMKMMKRMAGMKGMKGMPGMPF